MDFSAAIDYPVGPDEALAMRSDREFINRSISATGALRHTAEVVESSEGSVTITSRRAMPTDQVPASFRAFVGEAIDLRVVEAWNPPDADGARTGTLALEIIGAPVHVSANLSVRASGTGGCRQSVDGTITAQVPIFSRPIEEAAQAAVLRGLEAERTVSREWIAKQGDTRDV